jgi:hypothetical protein
MWVQLELGELRLVVDGGRLHVEPFDGTWVERRRMAWQYCAITAARRQVLQAAGIGARL